MFPGAPRIPLKQSQLGFPGGSLTPPPASPSALLHQAAPGPGASDPGPQPSLLGAEAGKSHELQAPLARSPSLQPALQDPGVAPAETPEAFRGPLSPAQAVPPHPPRVSPPPAPLTFVEVGDGGGRVLEGHPEGEAGLLAHAVCGGGGESKGEK